MLGLFHGLSAFSVTPTDQQGRVDTDHFSRLIENLCLDGITSIGVLGSTGGYVYLSHAERGRAVAAAVEAAGDKPVLAGIGSLATRDVISNAKAAEQAGAAALLLAPVSYLPLTDRDVIGLVADVVAETNLPICLYNNPTTTHFNFGSGLLKELSKNPQLCAVKNPPAPEGDFVGQIKILRALLPSHFSLGYSGDAAIAGALSAGCDAWYSVVAGALPEHAIVFWQARHDQAELQNIDDRFKPLWKTFTDYGSIRVIHEMIGMLGMGEVQLPRPLLALDQSACNQIELALDFLNRAD